MVFLSDVDVQNVLVVAISKAYGLDARDMKLERFYNTRGTGVYATTLSVAVAAGSDPATIERVLDGMHAHATPWIWIPRIVVHLVDVFVKSRNSMDETVDHIEVKV